MKISCLIGDPVDHSISPILFEELSRIAKLEYAHLKLRVNKKDSRSLIKTLDAIKTLNFVGFNVTLPYKTGIIKYLDKLDNTAKKIGAVNTVVNKNGYLKGYNTDAYGVITTIEKNLRTVNKNDHVVIFGAGGVARAVIYEISQKTNHITVFNRGKDRLKKLDIDFKTKDIHLDCYLLEEKNIFFNKITEANLIINATSVGMNPNKDKNLLPLSILEEVDKKSSVKKKIFFDVVFNPLETLFLKNAREHFGSKTVGGMQMMIYQGIHAFELWTEIKLENVDVKKIENILNKSLNEKV